MAKLRVTGKRFSINGMFGITMIAIAVVAVVAVVVAAIVLPTLAEVTDYEAPEVVAIVAPDDGLISVGADLSQVFVTVKYSDGSTNQVALSELVVTGLDTSTEGVVDGVVLDYGGFKQTISFNVVPTELNVEYIASTGGRIDGETIQSITAGADATRVEAIPDEGYYFAGWSDGDINASRLDTQVSKSMRLIAVFEKLRYTVVFYYPDGTTAREEVVSYNESPMRVPRADEKNMELYGYRFVGWDTDFTHITKDTNIYPIFEKYAADFHLEYTTDKSGRPLGTSDALSYYEFDELATVRVNANADRKFIGWSVFDVNTQTWISLDPVMAEGRLIHVGVDHSIEFISTRTGTTEEFVLSFTPDSEVEEILVKAHFVYLESEISFTSMNNKAHESFLIDYDTPIGEKFDVEDLTYLDMLGYEFKGWYVKGGEVKADGTPVLVNNQTTFSQPTELIAYWEKEIFAAVFLKGENEDAAFLSPDNIFESTYNGKLVTAYYQDTLAGALSGSFPEKVPTKPNYTFKGWYLADADRLPTSTVIDKTFKLENYMTIVDVKDEYGNVKASYPAIFVVPVFEVNTKTLTINVQGSGSINALVYDETYGVFTEKSISGKVEMPVNQKYMIRVRPSAGYSLSAVNVNGVINSGDNLAGAQGYYDLTIAGSDLSPIDVDYDIIATFKLTEYEISVTNGSNGVVSGEISYNVLGKDESFREHSNDKTISFPVNYGSGVSVEIATKQTDDTSDASSSYGYYISAIKLNGETIAVPAEAVYFNLIIEDVTRDNRVEIQYLEFTYVVTLPEDSAYGSMISESTLTSFKKGDENPFAVKANDGYYIKRVTANGTIIDPYISAKGYTINSLLVNGEAPTPGANDYRVTEMRLSIDSIEQNVVFEVEYAELYYNVTTSYEGVGSVTTPFTVSYGAPFHVNAVTSSGYYVHSVVVNGVENTFDDVQTAREYTVNSTKRDYDVKFIFKRTVYFVRFVDADGNSSVTYDEQTINIASSEGYTFNGIEHASTADFEVKAKEGYYINSITVTSNKGDSYDEIVNYSAKSHVVTLASINASYSVEIVCASIALDYDIHFINKANNRVVINNSTVNNTESTLNATYSSSIAYGNDLTVNITLTSGYSLNIDKIVVSNKDARDSYYYLPLSGEYNQAETNGFYALIAGGSQASSVTYLNVYDVNTAIDIYVTFDKKTTESSTNLLTYNSYGNGALTAVDGNGASIASGSSIADGLKVILEATPAQGNVLEALVVDGKEVSVDNNKYSYIVNADSYAYAVFSETKYPITIVSGVENGVVATDKSLVEAGTSFNVKLTPVEGYYASTFIITVDGQSKPIQPLNGAQFDGYKNGGMIEYTMPAEYVTGSITISASFAPIQYELTYTHNEFGVLGGVGDMGALTVYYGDTKEVELSARSGYYISEIVLNGESISTQTLIGTPVVTGEYTLGVLQVYITKDTTLDVTFSPMVYSITVNESLGGVTLVRKDGSAYVNAKDIKLSEGDNVAIKMSAQTGYHIQELRVNGVVDNGWKVENVSANDLTEIYYDLGVVTGNISLRVVYAINEYQIQVNVSNQSPNFSAVDVDSNTYGVVSITGYQADANGLYTGFTHGSNVKFVVTPRTGRGYYIARFEIQYYNADGELISNNINTLDDRGGSYILYGISSDIQAVNVEFRRRMFSYVGLKTVDDQGSNWECEGDIVATFTNPYAQYPVVVVDGMYEYGLNYAISVKPGVGYSRTSFTVNGEDRLSSVRNNNFIGTLTGEMNVQVVYTIDKFDVEMNADTGGNYYIYDIDDTLLWAPGIEIVDGGDIVDGELKTYAERAVATGMVWASEDGIEVTYGTEIIFVAAPASESGYRVSNFFVNRQARAIVDEDAVMREREVIVSHTLCEINFTIHTYTIEVNTFEGGVATLSTSLVEWNESVTLRLVINRGYVMKNVLLNGQDSDMTSTLEFGGTHTLEHITSNYIIEVVLANKAYDVTFQGDYNAEYVQSLGNGATVTAISGVILNQGSVLKQEKSYYTTDDPKTIDQDGKVFIPDPSDETGTKFISPAVFADKLTIVLTAPVGYKISAVTITMDNDGGVVSNLVLSESGLDAGDGSGTRTFTIPSMTGNVKVSVEYVIKTYTVEYVQRPGGRYESTGTTLVSHHELFEVNMISDDGYYLASLDINGRIIPTVVSGRSDMHYTYTTDTIGANQENVSLEINDELVNGAEKITILPTYEKQRFSVIFFINNLQITNLYQDSTLGVSLENNEIIFDAVTPTLIHHELQEGYSITSVTFYNLPYNDNGKSTYTFLRAGLRDHNVFTAKGESLAVTLDADILGMMDFHSTNKNTIRIYYETAKDVHTSVGSMYLVEGVDSANVGKKVAANEVPKLNNRASFTLSASFSDFKSSVEHEYNTEATYTVKIDANAINKYSFQGYQEKIDGEWQYVVNGVNGITLQSAGQILRYTMTSNREFRAVFFRTYEVTVQIHPEYKYTEGSFATNDPSRMKYRQYASLTAVATYSTKGDGVILPNVASTRETLTDTDGVEDASYTYRIISGATLMLSGMDNVSVNATRGYSYSVITYNGGKLTQMEDSYNLGVDTLEDRLVYAYFNNVIYASFAMETVGSNVSGEGGTVRYAVNGTTVASLSENSLTMAPNQTLTITITPKASYRFDSIMELLPLSEPDSQGFRQFSSTYTPLSATQDGRVQIVYYNESGLPITGSINVYSGRISRVVVTLNGLSENSIFKIRFWKQVQVTRDIQLITDEADAGSHLPSYVIDFTTNSSAAPVNKDAGGNLIPQVTYDYNDNLYFNLRFGLSDDTFKDYSKYYQFVGYFINGINAYTQLVQNYPSTYEGDFVVNDLDNLSNGMNIVETNTINNGVLTTVYSIEVVARFIPVYNIVIENEYLDNGNYLNPGPITATSIMYDQDLTQYFNTSMSIEPKLGAEVSYNTDINFQMLGKLNTIDNSSKNSASSPYNTWEDNVITLNWAGVSGSGDNFAFLAWQYYAYLGDGNFGWINIPYVDPNSQTNLVTKPNFTFPVSCLFSTSYAAYINSNGVVSEGEEGFTFDASKYDSVGAYDSSFELYAIRIRPLFQKVESLELVKSTALNDESIFLDGKGDVEPKIGSISRSSGNFNYYTVQTLIPATIQGYEFAGWYITENGQGGKQALLATGSELDHDLAVTKGTGTDGETTYYLKTEKVQDLNGVDTDQEITYSLDPNNNQISLLMNDSFKIFARYIRIYTISVKVTNLSGISSVLTDAMPTLDYYKQVDGAWVYQGEVSGERMITISDARVGTKLRFTLKTNYSGNINDSINFNPLYDRFAGITSVDENNKNVWDQNGSLDYQQSVIPDILKNFDANDSSTYEAYNDAVEDVEIIITANAQKTVNVNFESFGTLMLHNVYVGSSIKLPKALGEVLYENDPSSVEVASDVLGNDAYYVKDDGIGDAYATSTDNGGDGKIQINNVPINTNYSFDGEEVGDYATRLIDTANVLESDYSSIGVNFNGSSITKKVQNVAYYSTATWNEYVWKEGNLVAEVKQGSGMYDYPFADGGVSGSDGAGDGTEAHPFKIATVDHLRNVDKLYKGNNGTLVYGQDGANVLRVHFVQVADINLNETNNALSEPLCGAFTASNNVTYLNGFNGIYDGDGYTLYNLNFELSNSTLVENVGIFAKIYRGGVVKDLNIGRSYVYSSATNVGVLAGQVFGGTVQNVHTVDAGAENIIRTVYGQNFVGGLVGLLAGESDAEGLISNSSISNYQVTATVGGSYLGVGSDYTGGAGGLVGSIGTNAKVSGGNGTYTTSLVTVTSGSSLGAEGIGAGGIAGTIQASTGNDGQVAIENAIAIDAGLGSTSNKVAIGGVVGSIGANRNISNVTYRITAAMSIRSNSTAGFTTPNSTADQGNFMMHGGGGIAGFNNGTISTASVLSADTFRLTLYGSMVGGIVGVNFGTIENGTVRARLFTSRQTVNSSLEGGTYGGMVGYNVGTISGGGIQGVQNATNDYSSTSAAYEVVTAGNEAYIPTSGPNSAMHGVLSADTANLYIGGVAGYNEGTISNVVNNSKLMVNRRASDEISNYSYIGAIAGNSTNENISASGTAIIKYFNYIWVDQSNDVSQTQWAYIGNARGNGNGGSSTCSVTATASYCGGGTIYNQASIEAGFTWGFEGTGYLSGSASVYFYSVSGTASGTCPDWNVSGTIEGASDDGAVYSEDCDKYAGDISTLWKTAWNYTGYLRYIAVSSYSA
ncbi:MAG: InlB B-repeat-containing protein [Clostridia bacterium]|nr:InlB B-repeat-containing protein [Clostridia bacterium]